MTGRERQRLTTERLDIVQFTADDIQALIDGQPEHVEHWLGASFPRPFTPPPLMDDALPVISRWIRDHPLETWSRPWFFCERELHQVVGSVGFSGPAGSTVLQLGYSVYPNAQGRGFATEATRTLIQLALSDPRINTIQATVPPWNLESVRVVEKLGMIMVGEGTDDEVGPIHIYEIRSQ